MSPSVPASITVGGRHYQWTAEAEAGVELSTGARWWGTRLRYRPGTIGRWRSCLLVDVHPFDPHRAVELGLRAWLEREQELEKSAARVRASRNG